MGHLFYLPSFLVILALVVLAAACNQSFDLTAGKSKEHKDKHEEGRCARPHDRQVRCVSDSGWLMWGK